MENKNNYQNVVQTKYNGYYFRSRTEARWAVFFDRLCVKYEYEPEGFILPDGTLYLPDFYLPEFGGGGYFEVKPDLPNNHEWISKIEQLAKITGQNCFILNGNPDLKYYGKYFVNYENEHGFYHANDWLEKGEEPMWLSIAFCALNPNNHYIGGYFIDNACLINTKYNPYMVWKKYIDAVNYSRSFRFETKKDYL
jgi:hypothetical protein